MEILKELGNGLVLRRSTREDAEKIFAFNAMIHGEEGLDERIGQWSHDLVSKPHPTFGENDYTIIEETGTGRLVSSLNLISQVWTYDGIPFGVGRPELVGTLPEFRNRGLVRLQMEEVHRWSAERGQLVQAITGIPNYYRMYGYEMCVDLEGSRSGFEMNLPKLPDGKTEEPYRFRAATENDIPFLMEVSTVAAKRSLIYVERDELMWRYELTGRSDNSINRLAWNIIEKAEDGSAVGFIAHPFFSWGISVPAMMYELKPGISWMDVTPTVTRWLWELGRSICEAEGKTRSAFTFALAGSHPVYEIIRDSLPRIREPYSWYIRVPDLHPFINRIKPVLENRIENSLIPGLNGELKINFYKTGLLLGFENGKINRIDSWQPDTKNEGDASFPNYTFFQLLFGHRSLDELKKSYTDCYWSSDRSRVILNTLFPKKPSLFLGIS